MEVSFAVESRPRICPCCGEVGHVLGGTYHSDEHIIELLQGDERTVSELERFREILREARESGASPEQVRGTLQHEFPGWSQTLAKLLVPKTPSDFYQLLALIAAIVGALLAYKQAGQTTNIEVDQVTNNVVVQEASPVPEQTKAAPLPYLASGEKIGRNKLCPCESGKKFKKCHGVSGETRYYGPKILIGARNRRI